MRSNTDSGQGAPQKPTKKRSQLFKWLFHSNSTPKPAIKPIVTPIISGPITPPPSPPLDETTQLVTPPNLTAKYHAPISPADSQDVDYEKESNRSLSSDSSKTLEISSTAETSTEDTTPGESKKPSVDEKVPAQTSLQTPPNTEREVQRKVCLIILYLLLAPLVLASNAQNNVEEETMPVPSGVLPCDRPSSSKLKAYKESKDSVDSTDEGRHAPKLRKQFSRPNLSPADIALKLFQGKADMINHVDAAAWLGGGGTDRGEIRTAYMELFDWTDQSVLASLRALCDKLYMKAESQQLDKIIDAFSDRWCECNPTHGFKSPGVVYTLAYSILLLNTDHHSEEYTGGKKMPRSQYVQQTFETMKSLLKAEGHEANGEEAVTLKRKVSLDSVARHPSTSMKRWSANMSSAKVDNVTLVSDTTTYSHKEWDHLIISLLKGIYTSIDLTPLNLARGYAALPPPRIYLHSQSSASSLNRHYGKNTGVHEGTNSLVSRVLNRRPSWVSAGDTWSDYEFQGIMSSDTSGRSKRKTMYINANEPVGFSGVLRNTLIREDQAARQASIELGSIADSFHSIDDDVSMVTSLAGSMFPEKYSKEDEELELRGAPWAKEGLLKFQSFFDAGVAKKFKKRDWIEVFVIVQKGCLKIFRFDCPPQKQREFTFEPPNIIADVGGGNWLDRATMTDNIPLCHAMAQISPIKPNAEHARLRNSIIISSTAYLASLEPSHVQWSLTLPNKAVLLFQAGTKPIAEEYVYACNYWAARVSKEPLVEAVSSTEHGWNRPLELIAEKSNKGSNYKPSIQSGSYDTVVVEGERIQIKEWKAPLSSTVLSHSDESSQLDQLKKYNVTVEQALEDHNASRAQMITVFQSGSVVSTLAHSNWEKKSQYLLRETIKYGVYITTLEKAIDDKNLLLKRVL
jgi:hypothetical protein